MRHEERVLFGEERVLIDLDGTVWRFGQMRYSKRDPYHRPLGRDIFSTPMQVVQQETRDDT